MTVKQQRCRGHEPWIHTHGFPGIDLDEHEAVPAAAIASGCGFEIAQKVLPELENLFDLHADDQRLGSSGGGIGEKDIFKFVAARRQNGSALVYLGNVEQIEHGKMLDG